ncbi:STAS domain-containing protein [Cryptosporangium sp. NPDC051539]|uniref:STAS domain-containing protein n=1 Tax=Cryptosporangium sp. NPDC051539 TaxID=3363962 RepID=UPI00378881EB
MTGDEVTVDRPAAVTVGDLDLDLELDDAEPPGRPAKLVSFQGEIDLGTAPGLGTTVEVETADASAIVLDLSAVTFLDSAGVRLLDSLVGAGESRGCVMRLVAPEHGVARFTLTLCAFRSDLVESTVARAVATLN